MREILFRGKTESGEWVEGYLCKKYFQEVPHDRFAIMYKTEYDPKRWNPDYMTAEVYPETIGQYIGLEDKNGKKIFEGDILAYKIRYPERTALGVVCAEEWNCSCCGGVFGYALTVDNDLRDHDRCEIIGNIHDNPELVKGGDFNED